MQSGWGRLILRGTLIGCGTVVALLVAAAVWIGVTLSSGPDGGDLPAYHPFRSAEAKERYLERYKVRAADWPVPSESRIVGTSWGLTFVRVSGPEDARPVVLLPSTGASSLMWMPNIESLSQSFRVYALDQIYDYGRSVYTKAPKSAGDLVSWLDELFTALELENDVNLVGLSYGAWITSQYVLAHPDRLAGAVLMAPPATLFPLPGEWAWRGVLALIPHRYFMWSMTRWLFEDLVNRDEAGRRLAEKLTDDAFLAMRCFKLKMPVHPTVLTDEELASIQVPTLFLVGENEKIYSATEAVERLNRVAPQVRTEIIPGAGHDLTFVQTELVDHTIVCFLKELH
jgi:pimeloyl-ACP methyl ester carboxylesterase